MTLAIQPVLLGTKRSGGIAACGAAPLDPGREAGSTGAGGGTMGAGAGHFGESGSATPAPSSAPCFLFGGALGTLPSNICGANVTKLALGCEKAAGTPLLSPAPWNPEELAGEDFGDAGAIGALGSAISAATAGNFGAAEAESLPDAILEAEAANGASAAVIPPHPATAFLSARRSKIALSFSTGKSKKKQNPKL